MAEEKKELTDQEKRLMDLQLAAAEIQAILKKYDMDLTIQQSIKLEPKK